MSAPRRPLTDEEAARIDAMARARETGSFYTILGVLPAAPAADVDAAYHDLARQWHPDRFYSRDTGERGVEIEENFVAATRAYRTLRDPLKRQAYHREAGIDVKVAIPPPPSRERLVPLGGTGVRAGDTSPGGTRVYETSRRPAAPPAAATPPPPPPPPPLRPKVVTAVDKMRAHIAEQLGRARTYFDAGKVDFDAGRYAKAESALYLAMKFDDKNPTYIALHQQAAARAREGRAKGFLALAEQEESYQRIKEAIGWYQKAVDCDPPGGQAYFRLANLLRVHEQDARGAIANLRKAVSKEPENVAFHLALAELYESVSLQANALREVHAAIAVDPKNDAAKAMLKRLKR